MFKNDTINGGRYTCSNTKTVETGPIKKKPKKNNYGKFNKFSCIEKKLEEEEQKLCSKM